MVQKRYSKQSSFTFIFTIILAVATIAFTAFNVSKSSSQILRQKTESIALMIDAEKLQTLHADSRDEQNPVYLEYKSKLSSIQSVNPEIQFLYLMRSSGDSVVFLLDSVEEGGKDYSPPGQIYDEASIELRSMFDSPQAFTEIEGDRWGYWLTGFAPILDSDGKVVAVLGVDVDFYSQFMIPIVSYSTFVAVIFILILSMMFLNRRLLSAQSRALKEKNAILHITSHEVRTPLTQIRWACEMLLEDGKIKLNKAVHTTIKQTYMSTFQMISRINILNHTVELSEKETPQLEQVALAPIYSDLLSQYTLFAKLQNVTFTSKQQVSGEIVVLGDKEWLATMGEIIFLNVLFYADPQTKIETSFIDSKDCVQIIVSGEGKTLPQNETDHVFDGIHSDSLLTEHTEATGLGLFLVREYIERLKGSIRVEVNGKTTRFILAFKKRV